MTLEVVTEEKQSNSILNSESFDSFLDKIEQKALRQKAWKAFQGTPMPTRKDECWRFANLSDLDLDRFCRMPRMSEQSEAALVERSEYLHGISGKMIFADDNWVSTEPLSEQLQSQGVRFLSLKEAFAQLPDLMCEHFMKELTQLGSDKFFALHGAYTTSGAVLYVPKGVQIEEPFVVYHWLSQQGAAIFPHTLVVAEENAKVSLVDFYLSANEETSGFACGQSHVVAGDNANVFRKSIQYFNEQSTVFQVDTHTAGRDSQVRTVAVNLGGKRSRFENQLRMAGAGSNVEVYSLTVADESQEFDQRTLQVHQAPNTRSDLLYKNALLDKSRTIFSGLIRVEEEAQQTDAYQTNRNLILSDAAEASSLPGLEISANDVKCSHGATSSELDTASLFYMLSRGIKKEMAEELLVFGFFEEVIEKVESEELAENLRNMIREKFKRSNR
tara:strand:+ start:100175 stop:101506 length:1332 start_codon:yes stop_codon:yes gene_type:complete